MTPPRSPALALALFLLWAPAGAGTLKGGGEIRISEEASGDQASPRVGALPGGGFIVVWGAYPLDGSGSGAAGRRFSHSGLPAGGDFQANGYTTGDQGLPSVAAASEDAFVVAWSLAGEGDDYGVFARGFDGSGPLSAGSIVNGYTPGVQILPAVAGSGGGEAVIVWTSAGQDGSSGGIYARRVDDAGIPIGGEFRVNAATGGDQRKPEASMDASGRFVVVWESVPADVYGGLGVFARLFEPDGSPRGGELFVNAFALSSRFEPDVAMNRDGEFVVVWQVDEPGAPGSDVFARRYDSTGAPRGAEIPVNAWTTGFQESPSVAIDDFGNFAVVWQSYGQDGDGWGLVARVFDSGDQPVGEELQVNTWTTGTQYAPDVAAAGLGDFVVVWHSHPQDPEGYGVFGQRFLIAGFCAGGDADGDGACDDFDNCPALANASQADEDLDGIGDDCDVRLTSPLDGATLDCSNPGLLRPTFDWDPAGYDRFRVFLSPDPAFPDGKRVSSGDALLTSTSWTPSKKKWAQACRKAASSNPGDPVLHVRVHARDRDLAKGDPRRRTDSPAIQVRVPG